MINVSILPINYIYLASLKIDFVVFVNSYISEEYLFVVALNLG